MILDSATSHIGPRLLCASDIKSHNNIFPHCAIEVLIIPKNGTSWLQPNDLVVFGTFKQQLYKNINLQLFNNVEPNIVDSITTCSQYVPQINPNSKKMRLCLLLQHLSVNSNVKMGIK